MRMGLLIAWLAGVASCAAVDGLSNLSARGVAGAGNDALVAGFVITGAVPKTVLVRGAGPALTALGVSGALAQPRLEVFRSTTPIASNQGWDSGTESAAIRNTTKAVGAFEFAVGSRDAALLLTLAPGDYTAYVVPAGGSAAGVALIEIYDAAPEAASRLVNLSARARAGVGGETFIAGFVVAGGNRNRMLVRGVGPALTGFGVAGALADPRIEVFRESTTLGYNDDWRSNTNPGQVAAITQQSGAFQLSDSAKDSALTLPDTNGAYTVHLTSANPGQSGVGLIEIYDTAGHGALPLPRVFDLVGFARASGHGVATMTGGGIPGSRYDPSTRLGSFWQIDDGVIAAAGPAFATQLQTALSSNQPLVVELNTLIDLSRFGRPNTGGTAIAHPDLFAAGQITGTVGTLAIGSNKTIYSAFGNGGFRRGTLTVGGQSNIVFRNLKFRELWEWDDATGGAYDRNGWDYIVLSSNTSGAAVIARAHHIWIDHCDFEKAYDGLFDIVHGADLVTISWCKLAGAVSGESMRWVQRQMAHLEANRGAFPYYNTQRILFSMADITRREVFHLKANLVGNSTDANTTAHDIGYLNVTFHHNWYVSADQRMPRMRFGNAHVFNLLADSTAGRNVAGLSQAGITATSSGAVRVENTRFIDVRTPISNSVGTEPLGRIAVLNSVNLDSATNTDKGFNSQSTTPVAVFRWNAPALTTGLGQWPAADTAVMPSGYVPADRTLADYLDSNSYMPANLASVGVLMPADAIEAEQLRRYLQMTTAPR